jgi:hypothetical protein
LFFGLVLLVSFGVCVLKVLVVVAVDGYGLKRNDSFLLLACSWLVLGLLLEMGLSAGFRIA